MIKIFIIFGLVFAYLHAEVIVPENITADKKFLSKYRQFYNHYLKKDAQGMYEMEVPYFRFLYNFEKYQAYVSTLIKPKKVKLLEIRKKNDIIITKSVLEMEEKDATIREKWLVLDDEVFHKTEVFLLFED